MSSSKRALISAAKVFVVAGLAALIANLQTWIPDGPAFVIATTILKWVLKYIENEWIA